MYERSESGANSRRNLWFGVFYLCKATTERERNEFLTLWIVQSNLLSLIVLLFSIWSFGLFLFGFLYRSGCLHPFKSLFLWDDVIGAEVWQGAGLHYKQSLKLNLNLVKLIVTNNWRIILIEKKENTLFWEKFEQKNLNFMTLQKQLFWLYFKSIF